MVHQQGSQIHKLAGSVCDLTQAEQVVAVEGASHQLDPSVDLSLVAGERQNEKEDEGLFVGGRVFLVIGQNVPRVPAEDEGLR
jgi:hypothetical protein